MKRLLSTLLAMTMALTLVSCGKSNPTQHWQQQNRDSF